MTGTQSAMSAIRRVALGDVGSTNDEALALAASGETLPLWVTARRQLAGRGRQGAPWISEAGNLYASLLLARSFDLAQAAQLPLLTSLALHDALAAILGPAARLGIKWPNDLLLNRRKIAGILAESKVLADASPVIVVGCGVNCAHHPQATRHPATNLLAEGYSVSPEELFAEFSRHMAGRLAVWDGGAGFGEIRNAWLDRATGLGETIHVRLPRSTIDGVFAGLDAAGRLILRQASGERLVSAGELFFDMADAENAL
jgi:BirA family biotin operon repressor/biotin-[acetyl-CoA-carboxylase] ligase